MRRWLKGHLGRLKSQKPSTKTATQNEHGMTGARTSTGQKRQAQHHEGVLASVPSPESSKGKPLSDRVTPPSNTDSAVPSMNNISLAPVLSSNENQQTNKTSPFSKSSECLVSSESLPSTPSPAQTSEKSLWDRAYDALASSEPNLVKDYEDLLATETDSLEFKPNDANSSTKQARQAQLDAVIARGLQRAEQKRLKYTIAGHEFDLTSQIVKAADLVLWAKDWIGDAVKASPEASTVWAGVCLILPLLTAPKTAAQANRDGFAYVTARMRYYIALEPLLQKLTNNPGIGQDTIAEANNNIVSLYERIISFQMQSILRFFYSRLEEYTTDVVQPKKWDKMQLKIREMESTVRDDLNQMDSLVTRQELEHLNDVFTESLNSLKDLLSVSEQQLGVSKAQLNVAVAHLAVSEEQRGLAQKQLEAQHAVAQKKLDKRQEDCIRVFRLTSSNQDSTYEWYKNRVEDRVENTCQWFLLHEDYQRWLHQESGPLLVSADPGCGKSVLAKYLVDHELPAKSAPNTTICYFFFKEQEQNTVRQALCALLHQLFSKIPPLVENAMDLYSNEGSNLANSTQSLWTILTRAIRDPRAGPVTFILDALDECHTREFNNLMRNVKNQFSPNRIQLKILMTCRPYDQILVEFRPLLDMFNDRIHIPGDSESETISKEVDYVIGYRVSQLAREKSLPAKVKDRLAEKMLAVQHRTYLWVHLVFDYLRSESFKRTENGIDAAISTLPKTVNEAYEQILLRCKDPPRVRKIFAIILAATRPLTLSEMNVAANIEGTAENPSHSFENLDLEDDDSFKTTLRSLCGLFVSVFKDSVYFIHLTAREFLLRNDVLPQSSVTIIPGPALSLSALSSPLYPSGSWQHCMTSQDAQCILAELCIIYLHGIKNSILTPAVYTKDKRIDFFSYAARSWTVHFRYAGIEPYSITCNLALDLCENEEKSSAWASRELTLGYKRLILASHLGVDSVIKMQLDLGIDVNEEQNSDDDKALAVAVEAGHDSTAQMLIDAGAKLGTGPGTDNRALNKAAEYRRVSAIRMLLVAFDCFSPPGMALPAFKRVLGHRESLKVFFEPQAHAGRTHSIIDTVDERGRTALCIAAAGSSLLAVEMLLAAGANVHTRDSSGRTAMHHFATLGSDKELSAKVFRCLIAAGALIEDEDNEGNTPMMIAAKTNDTTAIDWLLEAGADVNYTAVSKTPGTRHMTALSAAAHSNRGDAIRCLLHAGAKLDINTLSSAVDGLAAQALHYLLEVATGVIKAPSYMNLGEGPWRSAIREKGPAQALVDANININAMDDSSYTILMRIVQKSEPYYILNFLLDIGADPNITSSKYGTALTLASDLYQMQVLIAAGATVDPRTESKNNRTPLMNWATLHHPSYPDQVKALVDAGADVNAKDNEGNTPLLLAVGEHYNCQILRILADGGADVNAANIFGDTPLLLLASNAGASYSHDEIFNSNAGADVLDLLLKYGADVCARNTNDETPLMKAAIAGSRCNIISDLLKTDAEYQINEHDKNGETALMKAAIHAMPSNMRKLLAAGADVHARDKRGRTALMMVDRYSGEDAVHDFRADAMVECYSLLLNAGANLADVDNDGRTAKMLVSIRLESKYDHLAKIEAMEADALKRLSGK